MASAKQAAPETDPSAALDAEMDRALLGRSLFAACGVAVARDAALLACTQRPWLLPLVLVELFVLWRLAVCVGFWPFTSAACGVAAPVVALLGAWLIEPGLAPWGSAPGVWVPVGLGFAAASAPPARAMWIALDWVRKWEAAERMGIVHKDVSRAGDGPARREGDPR